MSKTPNRETIPIETWEESRFDVHPLAQPPIVQPSVESIDKLAELLEDHIATGGDARALIRLALGPELNSMLADTARRLLAVIYGSPRPRLVIDQLRWVCGQADMEGETITVLARRHRMTKQAFHKGCGPLRDWLYLRSQSCRNNVTGEDRRVSAKRSALASAEHLRAWMGRQNVEQWGRKQRDLWRRELWELVKVYQKLSVME